MKRQATIISRLLAIARSSALRVPFLFLAVLGIPGIGYSNPSGATVRAGSATFTVDGNDLIIETPDQRAIIDWQDFSIGLDELTQFVQPGANAAVLNRVTGSFGSTINGQLSANGQIFLINPHGIMVGPNGQIDASSFVASTLDVQNADFLAGGDLVFSGDSDASIVNLGSINALGGDVFMFARHITNQGIITAADGTVGLGAGQEVLLKAAGDERIQIKPNGVGNVAGTGIDNQGVIESVSAELKANGGNIYALGIKNSGRIRAAGAVSKSGRVFLVAGPDSDVEVSGTGRVTAEGGADGGVFIEGRTVSIADTAVVEGVDLPVEIEAADLFLGAQARLSSGTADMTITATGDGASVGEDRKGLNLSNDELARIESGNFYLNADAGIMVDGAVVPGSIGGRFFFDGGASGVEMIGGASEFLNGGGFEVAGSAVVGTDVTSVGGQTFLGQVEVADHVTFRDDNGGDIELLSGADGDGTAPFDFAVTTAGTARLQGDFGSVNPFDSFNFDGGGMVEMNDANLLSVGNTIIFNNPVFVTGHNTLTDTTGDIIFNSTLNGIGTGPWGLTINTPGGGTTGFHGDVGGDFPLAFITTDAAGVTELSAEINTVGNQTFNDPVFLTGDTVLNANDLILGSGIDAQGNSLTLNLAVEVVPSTLPLTNLGGFGSTGPGGTRISADFMTPGSQTYGNAIVDANVTLTSTNGAINFDGTLDADATGSDRVLILNSGGVTAFNGEVGGSQQFESLTTDAAGSTRIGADITTDGSTITFMDPVVLTADSTITEAGPGNVTFQQTVDSDALATPRSLTVNAAGGDIAFQGVVGATPLNTLTTSTTGNTEIGANVTTVGDQTYSDPVLLTGDATLSGNALVLGGALDAQNNDLTLDLATLVTLPSALYTNVNNFGSIGSGGTLINASFMTPGSQTYGNAVTLADNLTLDSTNNSDIIFNGTIDGTFDLTVSTGGTTEFNGTVGGGTPLMSLSTDDGGNTEVGANVTTSGLQDYDDDVLLTNDAVLTASDVMLGTGGLNGQGNNLTLATTDQVDLPGGITGVQNFTSNGAGGTLIDGNFTTSGFQLYSNAVTIGETVVLESTGAPAASAITFNGVLDADATASDRRLTIRTPGVTTFNGTVGSTAATRLAALTTDGGGTTRIGADINTEGSSITFVDDVVLTVDTTITESGPGDVTFQGLVDSDAIGTPRILTVNTPGGGDTIFQGVVGTTPLASLTTDAAGDTQIGANVTTNGVQNYNDAVLLTADVTLTGSDLMTGGNVDGQNNSLTIGFAANEEVNGTRFANIDDFTAEQTTTIDGNFTTGGFQLYKGASTLGATVALGSSGDDAISWDDTLTGPFGLTVNTGGETRFGDTAAGDDPVSIGSLTTDSGGSTKINAASVTTTGDQIFGDEVILGTSGTGNAMTTLSFANANFNDEVNAMADGVQGLVLNGTGTANFGDNAGHDRVGGMPGASTTRLASLDVDAGAVIKASSITTTGNQRYRQQVLLDVNDGLPVSNVTTLTGTDLITDVNVDGQNNSLTIDFNVAEEVSDARFMNIDDFIAVQQSRIDGNFTTFGSQNFQGASTLEANVILTSSGDEEIGWDHTLDAAGAFGLTVNTGGVTRFGDEMGDDRVGGIMPLAFLTTDDDGAAGVVAPDSTKINATSIATTGDQTYGDAVVLGMNDANATNDVTLTFASVNFNHTVDAMTNGGQGLVLSGTTANFGDGMGHDRVGGDPDTSTTKLESLDVNAGAVIKGSSITTTGDQRYRQQVLLDVNDGLPVSNVTTLTGNDLITDVNVDGQMNSLTIDFNVAEEVSDARFMNIDDFIAEQQTRIVDDFTTLGIQNYQGASTLDATVMLTSSGDEEIGWDHTLDAAGAFGLTVNTGGVTRFGDEMGDDRVGGIMPLAFLTTDDDGAAGVVAPDSTKINATSITTTGDQTYGDAVVLGMNDVNATNLVTLNFNDASFNHTIDAMTAGDQGLVANSSTVGADTGETTFGDTMGDDFVGNGAALASLETNDEGSTKINATSITTTGDQIYGDAVVLGMNDANASNLVTLSFNDASFNGTVDAMTAGGQGLVANSSTVGADTGETTFGDQIGHDFVGNGAALASLATNDEGSTTLNTTSVTTAGDQTYEDMVVLGSNNLSDDTTLNFNDAQFDQEVDGTDNGVQGLTLNSSAAGTTTFGDGTGNDRVGGDPDTTTTALAFLTTNNDGSTVLNTSSVATAGDQIYRDQVVLGSNTSSDDTRLDFNDAQFDQEVDAMTAGVQGLTANSNTVGADTGETTFGDGTGHDLVGGNAALAFLTTNDDGTTVLNASSVTTELNGAIATSTGNQTYGDMVVLGSNNLSDNTTLNFNNAQFDQEVDATDAGVQGLTANSLGGGVTTFGDGTGNDHVGGNEALAFLTTDDLGSTKLNASSVTTELNGAIATSTGDQTYGDMVVLGSNNLSDDTTLNFNNAQFDQEVDAMANGRQGLTVNSSGGGTTTFGDGVGDDRVGGDPGATTTALAFLTTNADGTTTLNSSSVTTEQNLIGPESTGDQEFGDDVILGGDVVLTGNDVTFFEMLDSAPGADADLRVNSMTNAFGEPGVTTFLENVGSADPLGQLTTNANGETQIRGDVTTVGGQFYNDPVVLTGSRSSTLTSDNGGNIRFGDTVDGERNQQKNLAINTGGDTIFKGLVGSERQLNMLTTDPGGATVLDVAGSRFRDGKEIKFTVSTITGQTYGDEVQVKQNAYLNSNRGNLKFDEDVIKTGGGKREFGAFTARGGQFSFAGNVGTAGNQFEVVALQSDQTIRFNSSQIFAKNLSLVSKEGSITQNGGGIDATKLAFDARRTVEFNGAANDFDTIAGKAKGDITIRDKDDLDIGSADLYTRRFNGAGDPIAKVKTLSELETDGSITLNVGGNVMGPENGERIVADVLTVNSGGVQELLTDVNAYQGTGSSITIDELNEIELLDVEAATVDVMAGGQITATQVAGTDVTLNSTGGGVEIGSVMAGNELNLLATGDITQTGPFSADRLSITGGSIIDLPDPNNQLNILGPVERGGEFILRDAGGGLTIEGPINTGDVNSSVQITTKGGLTLAGGPIGVSGGGNQLILSADEGGPGGEINNLGGEGVLEIGSGVDAFLFATSINGSEFGGLLSDYFEFGLVYPDNFPFELPVLSGNRGFSMGFIFALIGEGDPDLLALSSFDFDLAPADILGDEDEFLLNSEENDEQLREYIARLKSASRDKAVENPEHITIGPFELTGYEFEMWGNGGVEPTDTGSPSMYNIPGLDGPGGVFEGGEPVPYPTNIELPGDDGAEAIPIVPASDLFGTDDPGGGGGGAATGVPDTEPAAAGTEAE